MTTIEDQVRDAAPSPRSSPDVEAIWRRGNRRRLVDRALVGSAGVAFAALIAVAATALTAGPGTGGPIIAEPPLSTPTGAPSFDAAPPPIAPADPLPAGWQRIEVGDARLGLPPDVSVIVQQPGDEARCTNGIDTDTAFVAPDGLPAAQLAGEVICPAVRPGSVALTVVPLSTLPRLDSPVDALPLRANGVVGSRISPNIAGLDTRTYRFPSLDLQLTFEFLDNRPDLDDEVLATLARADDSRPIEVDVPVTASVAQQPDPFTVELGEVYATADGTWVHGLTIINSGDEILDLSGPTISLLMEDEAGGLLFATGPDCDVDPGPPVERGCDTITRSEVLGPGESLDRTVTLTGTATGITAASYVTDVQLTFTRQTGSDAGGEPGSADGVRESTLRLSYEVREDLVVALSSSVSELEGEVLQEDAVVEPPQKCPPPYIPIEVMPLPVVIPDEFRVQVVVGDEVRVDQLAIVYEAEDGTEVRRQVAAGDLPSGTHEVSVPLDLRDGDGRPLEPGQAYRRRAEIDYTKVATTGTGPCEQAAGGSGQLGTTLDTFGFQE